MRNTTKGHLQKKISKEKIKHNEERGWGGGIPEISKG